MNTFSPKRLTGLKDPDGLQEHLACLETTMAAGEKVVVVVGANGSLEDECVTLCWRRQASAPRATAWAPWSVISLKRPIWATVNHMRSSFA